MKHRPDTVKFRTRWRSGWILVALLLIRTTGAGAESRIQTLLEQANTELAAANVENAARLFRQVLSLQPQSIEGRIGLAKSLSSQGRLQEAIEVYRSVNQANPAEPLIASYIGENYMALGQYDQASAWLHREIELDPSSAWAFSLLGTLASQLGDATKAQHYFSKAAGLDLRVATWRYNSGSWYGSQGEHVRALWEYHAALSCDAGLYAAYFGQGVSYAALGKKRESYDAFQNYLRFDQTSDWARRAREHLSRLNEAPTEEDVSDDTPAIDVDDLSKPLTPEELERANLRWLSTTRDHLDASEDY